MRRVGVAMAGVAWASVAWAQMPLSYTQDASPGILALPPVTEPAAPSGYTLSPTTNHIHGYLSTGLSTGGGRSVDGGVLVPVVPGKVELEVGGGTGRVPVWTANGKTKTASYDNYYAALHTHPTADMDIDLAVSGNSLHVPRASWP